jgi:tRNA nucleotidyltransferase (CCA-adding enzyme)
MGGGGGGTFLGRSPKQIIEQLKKVDQKLEDKSFDIALAGTLDALLSKYNDKDSVLINDRLDEIETSLKDYIQGYVNTLFGGSVAKHTYVDGLSDVDSLLIINKSELADYSPQQVLSYLDKILKEKFGENVEITKGSIALTLSYSDGMELQILPALQNEKGLKIPSWKEDTWSQINPKGFTEALSGCNTSCNMKLIPTIKLAKAINATLPEQQQLSGYHIESLAIETFKSYDGPKLTSKMIVHFFEKAKDLILNPIKDKTGQSRHVDDYLGDSNSEQRLKASHILNRIYKRMTNASALQSQEQWSSFFE